MPAEALPSLARPHYPRCQQGVTYSFRRSSSQDIVEVTLVLSPCHLPGPSVNPSSFSPDSHK